MLKVSQDNGDDCKLPCSFPAVRFTCNFCTQNLGFNVIVGFSLKCFIILEATVAGCLVVQINSKF